MGNGLKYPWSPDENYVSTRKAKRNKQPTECKDRRRQYGHCGMCGSENVVTIGVYHCARKDAEWDFFRGPEEGIWFWDHTICRDCMECYDGARKTARLTRHDRDHCLDCGAVKGPLCPACGRNAWKHPFNSKMWCNSCGFRK